MVKPKEESHGRGSFCRVKAVISALDGLLAAEELAGVEPGPLAAMAIVPLSR